MEQSSRSKTAEEKGKKAELTRMEKESEDANKNLRRREEDLSRLERELENSKRATDAALGTGVGISMVAMIFLPLAPILVPVAAGTTAATTIGVVAAFEQKVKTAKENVNSAKRLAAEAQKNVTEAKQDMKRLTGEVSSLQRSLSDLRRDLSVLEDELRRSDSERKKIAGILDDIRGALTKAGEIQNAAANVSAQSNRKYLFNMTQMTEPLRQLLFTLERNQDIFVNQAIKDEIQQARVQFNTFKLTQEAPVEFLDAQNEFL